MTLHQHYRAPHFREQQKKQYHGVQNTSKFKNKNRNNNGSNLKALKPIDFSNKTQLSEIIKDLYDESEKTKNRCPKEVSLNNTFI